MALRVERRAPLFDQVDEDVTPTQAKQPEAKQAAAAPEAKQQIQTVGALTRALRSVIETSFAEVIVEGEISNYLHHRSGHRYWTLKDNEAAISAVFWKTRSTTANLKDGMKVVCRGRLTLYPPRGQYQLDVFQVRPVGIGDLQKAFEELYHKLSGEGLFDPRRKREIPRFPKLIGIVTSETGAAIHDMITVLRRRYPVVRVVLRPAAVQGMGAELDVARGIQQFNLMQGSMRPDVLIVGRGGGSLEDLWAFNEEAVARAIYASEIPVISAVGHEVDTTIADMVADLRAPTPTAAAELATPDQEELLGALRASQYGMRQLVTSRLRELRHSLMNLGSGYALRNLMRDQLEDLQRSIERAKQQSDRVISHRLERDRLTLERDIAKLKALSPIEVLKRGYAIVESKAGKVITTSTQLEDVKSEGITITFADGKASI